MAISLAQVKDTILDFFFPPFCVSCRQNGEWICADCLSKRRQESTWQCLVCDQTQDRHAICPACQHKQPLKGIFISGHFDEVMQRTVHAFKYQSSSVLAKPLAHILADHLMSDPAFAALDRALTVLVPVPLHKSKQHLRGYNQSELLAKALLPLLPGLTVANAITRTRATASQMELDRHDRLQNMKAAFALVPTVDLKEKTVILIDDVATTGSTLFECAKALQPASPKTIWAAVLAHG